MSCRQVRNGPSNVHTSGASTFCVRPFAWRRTDFRARLRLMVSRFPRCPSVPMFRQEAGVASGNLHRDLGSGIGAVIASAVDAAGIVDPVAFGKHADDLRPTPIAALGPIRPDLPL